MIWSSPGIRSHCACHQLCFLCQSCRTRQVAGRCTWVKVDVPSWRSFATRSQVECYLACLWMCVYVWLSLSSSHQVAKSYPNHIFFQSKANVLSRASIKVHVCLSLSLSKLLDQSKSRWVATRSIFTKVSHLAACQVIYARICLCCMYGSEFYGPPLDMLQVVGIVACFVMVLQRWFTSLVPRPGSLSIHHSPCAPLRCCYGCFQLALEWPKEVVFTRWWTKRSEGPNLPAAFSWFARKFIE